MYVPGKICCFTSFGRADNAASTPRMRCCVLWTERLAPGLQPGSMRALQRLCCSRTATWEHACVAEQLFTLLAVCACGNRICGQPMTLHIIVATTYGLTRARVGRTSGSTPGEGAPLLLQGGPEIHARQPVRGAPRNSCAAVSLGCVWKGFALRWLCAALRRFSWVRPS